MKAMAWAKESRFLVWRPSLWLGFLLVALVIAGTAIFAWEQTGTLLFFWKPTKIGAGTAVFAVFFASMGWTVTSLVTLRNSVKQHTMNTLLQSRLSATYMEHVKNVNSTFFSPHGEIIPLTKDEVLKPPPGVTLGSLNYLLNYFEFVAVGIRHGDLDEALLKSSLRGMVCSIYCVALSLINARRAELGPDRKSRSYENLCWLHERWRDDGNLPPRVCRCSALTVNVEDAKNDPVMPIHLSAGHAAP